MKLTSFLPFAAFFSFALADLQSITAAITKIQSDTLQLNETVAGFNGNPLTVLQILAESTALLADINKAAFTAQSSANLSDTDALTLAGTVQALSGDVTSTLTTIVDKKPVFQRELLAPGILLNLVLEKDATDRFSSALVSKVPPELQTIAQGLTQPIDQAFDSAIAAYK
ncbi:MAG: hypothetical protein Q9227_001049 [Pyrenula ochraceoflavens]